MVFFVRIRGKNIIYDLMYDSASLLMFALPISVFALLSVCTACVNLSPLSLFFLFHAEKRADVFLRWVAFTHGMSWPALEFLI